MVDHYSSSSAASPPGPKDYYYKTTKKRRAGRKKFRETRHPVYRGVRARAGSRWVCEVREPQSQARIWLGTYPTPEMAARAHDVAAIALRGAHQKHRYLNFPDSAHALPRPRSAAPDDIRCAAAQAAELYRPKQMMASASSASASASASSSQQLQPQIAATPPPNPSTCGWAAAGSGTTTTTAAAFLDEDAIFDMPGLIHDMARGMLLTPPPMMAATAGLHCYYYYCQGADDDDHTTHVDATLWTMD